MPIECDAAPNPVRNIRKVQKFAVGGDFEAYAKQLEFCFVANGVTDPRQEKAVLLTNLPTETYKMAKDLMAPILLRESSLTYVRHDRRAFPKEIEAPEIFFSLQV